MHALGQPGIWLCAGTMLVARSRAAGPPSRLAVFLVAVATALGVAGAQTQLASAALLSFPGDGWTNPVAPAGFEDWNFGTCGYVPGKAHLGADSHSTHAGQSAVAMGAGKVVKIVDSNW